MSRSSSFHRLGRGAALTLLALCFASPAGVACKSARQEPAPPLAVTALPALDARHAEIRADFDRDAARPRLLVLASPT